MNYCIINGEKVYPTVGNNIKITKENPLIKDRDAQTMEIEFPLSIYNNRKFFGNVNRIDVVKHSTEYNDCILYSNNLLIIKGKGTITSYTEKAVKLQIISGIRMSYTDDYYSSIYIDEIDAYANIDFDPAMLDEHGYRGLYALPPVYDETNDIVLNRKDLIREKDDNFRKEVLQNIRIQPFLAYVVRRIFYYLGYTLNHCFLDEEPWSRMLVYNNKNVLSIKGALPHWSIKTFLSELKKLFNIGYVYDEEKKTVSLNRYFDTLDTVHYECLDEFSTDYDEDGLEYINASNLKYNLSDAEENRYADIDEEVLSKFTIKDYVSISEAQKDIKNMSEIEKMTSVFRFSNDPFGEKWGYCSKSTDNEGNTLFTIYSFAWYMHVRRDEGNDTSVELNIVPAAAHHVEFDIRIYDAKYSRPVSYSKKIGFSMPSSTNDNIYTEEEIYSDYISVEDYLKNGNEPSEREESERMELYFLTGNTYSFDVDGIDNSVTFLSAGSEYDKGSFRFDGGRSDNNIGIFHPSQKWIENKEQVVIKFLSDDVPDTKKIFVFRNKKFICDKIDINITDNGIDKLMTGYFYELTL